MAAGTVVTLESHPALATAVFVAVGGAPPKSCAYPGGQLVRTATYPMMKVLRWSARGVVPALLEDRADDALHRRGAPSGAGSGGEPSGCHGGAERHRRALWEPEQVQRWIEPTTQKAVVVSEGRGNGAR